MKKRRNPLEEIKIEFLRTEDINPYNKMRTEIIQVLERYGGYEPAIENIHVNRIAKAVIYMDRVEILADAPTATEHTHSSIADIKTKYSKIINDSLNALAINRRDRLTVKDQSGLLKEMREALLRGDENE